MVETKILVDEEDISYEGLFSPIEVYNIVDEFLSLKGYDKFELLNEEQVLEEGKQLHIIYTPIKWHTDYIRKALKIDIRIREVKEVETTIDKLKVKMCQGKLKILFSGILHTDWEGRWEQRPIYYMIKTMFDKYLYRAHQEDFEKEIIADVTDLKKKVGAYLNLYRFKKAV